MTEKIQAIDKKLFEKISQNLYLSIMTSNNFNWFRVNFFSIV